MKGFSDLSQVEYEPPDSNVSVLLARREFLLAVARIKPEVINDLFSCCWNTFLRAIKHRYEFGEDSWPIVEATSIDELLKDWFLTDSFTGMYFYERSIDFTKLRHCLFDWGREHQIRADWCYDFGRRVLVDFWKTQLDWKPIAQLIEEKEKKEKEEERLRLEKIAESRKQSPNSLLRALAKMESSRQAQKVDSSKEDRSPNSYQPPEKYKMIAGFAAGIACEFHVDSWEKIANEIVKDAKSQLIVPEHIAVSE